MLRLYRRSFRYLFINCELLLLSQLTNVSLCLIVYHESRYKVMDTLGKVMGLCHTIKYKYIFNASRNKAIHQLKRPIYHKSLKYNYLKVI